MGAERVTLQQFRPLRVRQAMRVVQSDPVVVDCFAVCASGFGFLGGQRRVAQQRGNIAGLPCVVHEPGEVRFGHAGQNVQREPVQIRVPQG
jgi:hypothetical protein